MIQGLESTVIEQGEVIQAWNRQLWNGEEVIQGLEPTVMEQGRSDTRLGIDSYGTGKK